MSHGFVSSLNRITREMQRSAREHQRNQLRAVREAERAKRAYEQARRVDEKERMRLYIESQLAEVESQNEQNEHYVKLLGEILIDGLTQNPTIDFASLRKTPVLDIKSRQQEPLWSSYEPERPKWPASIFYGPKHKYAEALEAARQVYNRDLIDFRDRQAKHEESVQQAKIEVQEHNIAIDRWCEDFAKGDPNAIAAYFTMVLENSTFPDNFPQDVRTEYQPDSKQLIIAYDLPEYEVLIPKFKAVKYIKTTDSFSKSALPEGQRRGLYADVVAQTALRSIHEVFVSDSRNHVETIVFNGYVQTLDRSTGKPIRPCIVTVRTTSDAFRNIDLGHVDPSSCLKALNASVSKSAAELVPVRPVLELNMTDPRFIKEDDVLSTLDQRPNLMDLTPGEFESLITNLFQKMGLETRQTQASRDGGVDCVAFDPRPIFGGKVVIQAKRYKNTVGVSAVRDLYGTMQNEGASKGILVTTSGYGKAAFEFANGKPMELLAGSNLLYLLKEHANIDAKIVAPENWRDTGPDDLAGW